MRGVVLCNNWLGNFVAALAQGVEAPDLMDHVHDVSAFSLPPLLVPHRQTIQLIPVELPARHEAIHQADEAPVVGWFKKMRHFVDDDVFQAFAWLFGEVGV